MPSENGWEPARAGSDILEWVTVPGTNPPVRLQLMKGPPLKIMRAFAADFNAYIEPLRDADSAAFTPTNSVATSNHLNGTAMDLNWNSHPFRVDYAGFDPDKIRRMRELLAFYNMDGVQIMFWAQDWKSPKDAMHHQMGYKTWNNPVCDKFIRERIRADGFSTYRREGVPVPPPPPPPSNAADVLARATGITLAKAIDIFPQVSFALTKANCTNPRRIAAALAQWVIESGHFKYTEEIADGPESQERWKYKGRTWIQLTWLENYQGFSQWCHSIGLVPTSDYFVVRPHELAEQKWAALGPAYWWAIKYPQINEYADRGDIDNVSKWVNAPAWVGNPNRHANGEKERRDAYNKALALGDQLLALTTGAPPPPPAPPPAAPEPYGMPRGSNSGGYGGGGVKFPDWVYQLGNKFGLKPSTYPGHQENNRNEAGFAPNPQGLNRGIDWAAPGAADEVDRMQRFADYLFTVRGVLEQVIWQNPNTGRRVGVAGGKDVTNTGYYDSDYGGHRNHVHTRQSRSIPIPGTPPTQGEDDMAQVPQDQWDRVYRELTQLLPSRSRLRWLDDRQAGGVDTLAGMTLNADGNTHVVFVKELAALGHPESLNLLNHLASGDPAKYPDRAEDIQLAQAILAELNTRPPAPRAMMATQAAEPQIVEKIVYRDPPPPEVVYLPAVVEPSAPQATNGAEPAEKSVGELIGQLYNAIAGIGIADALSIEDRAALAATIKILETKNGSQL